MPFYPRASLVGSIILLGATAEVCLPSAIAPDQRRNVEQSDESYPLGIWLNDWTASHAASALVGILLTEQLGYNVTFNGVGPGTVDAFFALAGCLTPLNMDDRGCGRSRTYSHISMEGWTKIYQAEWEELQVMYPSMAPKNLGNMGYHGSSSVFVARSALDAGMLQEGLPLEFFRSYDAKWNAPWRYFQGIADVDKNELQMCNRTRFMNDVVTQRYLALTGDSEGVFVQNETTQRLAAYCPDGFFWLPPSCRTNQSQCIVYITGGQGWGLDEMMQKTTLWNMPVALAVAQDWSDLPRRIRGLFYWWVPDPTFLELKPQEIIFPAYDQLAWTLGDKRSSPDDVSVDILVSQDLAIVAPAAQDFLDKFRIGLKDVDDMMLEQKVTGDSFFNVTCRWLRNNTEIWREWVPDRTQCFPGFGLYNTLTDRFVDNRLSTVGLSCQACQSGSYSRQLLDDSGNTYICELCPAGRSQVSGAALSCDPCEVGSSQPMEGSISCERCGKGTFQDEVGQSECKTCEQSTTLGFGSVAGSDCGCEVGYIRDGENGTCQECGEGLSCPFHSSMATLLTGVSDLGRAFDAPMIRSGYFSTLDEPRRIYKCVRESHCGGGTPGTCAGGRVGVPCALCPDGQHSLKSGCVQCEDWRMLMWVLCMLGGVGFITCAYYMLTSTTTAKASIMLATTCAFGMFLNSLQVAGIIGLITVDWPDALVDMFGVVQLLLFDLDNFGFSCVVGSSPVVRYVISVGFFPALIAYIGMCFVISRAQPNQRLRWEVPKLLSTLGQFMQVGYSPMTTLALAPFMCYQHPTGLRSMLKYPSILCGSDAHGAMLIAGLLLLVFFVLGFLTLCCFLAHKLPAWSVGGKALRVRACKFLIFRFRLDRWWYGVPLLAKGPLMSLPVVLATDYPPVQTTFVQLFIALYLVLQVVSWPWKTPVLNAIDAWIGVSLVMLINNASLLVPDLGTSMLIFVDMANSGAVVSLGFAIFFLICMVLLAFCFRQSMGSYKELWIFNLGGVPIPSLLANEFDDAATRFLNLNYAEKILRLESLSAHDLKVMVSCLTIIRVELLPRVALGAGRLSVRPINSSISLQSRMTAREDVVGFRGSAVRASVLKAISSHPPREDAGDAPQDFAAELDVGPQEVTQECNDVSKDTECSGDRVASTGQDDWDPDSPEVFIV